MAERPAAPCRLGRSPIGAVLVAACLGVTACGSATSITILNTEKIERAIEQSVVAQRGRHAQVSCPSGVHQTKGLVFFCTAIVKGATTRFMVTELDGSGQVHYVAL
ncbi:MAG: DUF4333 domain-containing protein [Solirubrobacteraceae bacterium]